jgi:hypothetical protein
MIVDKLLTLGGTVMETSIVDVRSLGDYRLQITFMNGSIALVNMKNRIQSMRFHILSDPKIFDLAKSEGDRIIWENSEVFLNVFVNEIIDSMYC